MRASLCEFCKSNLPPAAAVYLKTTTTTTAGCPVRVHRLPPVPPSGGVRATVTASEPTAAAAAVSREVCRRRWRGRPRNRVGNGNSSNRLRAAIVSDHSRRRRRRRSFIVSASAVLPVSNGPSPHHCSRARPRVLFARRRRSVSTRRTHARSRRVSLVLVESSKCRYLDIASFVVSNYSRNNPFPVGASAAKTWRPTTPELFPLVRPRIIHR